MKTIIRKSLLYKTEVEYGDYTINHIEGCSHGCLYPCYAMMMAKRFGKVKHYQEWVEPKIVSNALELLEEEIPKNKDRIKFVHLCFSTDPFMYGYEEISKLSYKIIERLNADDIRCTALTKGLLPISLANLSKENEFGITLITLKDDYREKLEPFASMIKERIKHLYYLHKKGLKTWVSIEPYPTPNIIPQDFLEILEEISFVDKIIFGRLNYNAKVSEYKEYKEFFNDLSYQVIQFCERNNKDYHIKSGTITEITKQVNKREPVFAGH
ncbi:MAG: radical SAM protein [Candidatus Firestonebacteria bacterium]